MSLDITEKQMFEFEVKVKDFTFKMNIEAKTEDEAREKCSGYFLEALEELKR